MTARLARVSRPRPPAEDASPAPRSRALAVSRGLATEENAGRATRANFLARALRLEIPEELGHGRGVKLPPAHAKLATP